MIKVIDFTDETRGDIVAEQEALHFRLVEEQRYIDGNYLIFTDEPYVEPESVGFERLNPTMGVEQRLTHVEEWLEKRG